MDERKQVEPRAEGVLRSRLGSTVKQLASASPPTGGKLGDSDDSDEDSEGWGWPLIENSRPCHLPSGYDDDDDASSGNANVKTLIDTNEISKMEAGKKTPSSISYIDLGQAVLQYQDYTPARTLYMVIHLHIMGLNFVLLLYRC